MLVSFLTSVRRCLLPGLLATSLLVTGGCKTLGWGDDDDEQIAKGSPEEIYREARDSWKLDLALADGTQIELFSFPDPPPRVSRPEACGLRHLALRVTALDAAVAHLAAHGVESEPVRIDEYTGKRFTFFADPDGLPLELYEV